MTGTEPATPPCLIADDDATVAVQKHFTRMGERLELVAGSGVSTRLDAIMLESLAWQDADELAGKAAEGDVPARAEPAVDDEAEWDGAVRISSEFARATVEPVDDGGRLAVEAPKLGYEIELGPRELAWVATQPHTTFSEWLERPFGPGGDDHSH